MCVSVCVSECAYVCVCRRGWVRPCSLSTHHCQHSGDGALAVALRCGGDGEKLEPLAGVQLSRTVRRQMEERGSTAAACLLMGLCASLSPCGDLA